MVMMKVSKAEQRSDVGYDNELTRTKSDSIENMRSSSVRRTEKTQLEIHGLQSSKNQRGGDTSLGGVLDN